MMMIAMMTTMIMLDLLCVNSTYDVVTFENNCVSELFPLVAEHTDMSVLISIQNVH